MSMEQIHKAASADTFYHCIDCGMDTQPGYPTGDEIRAAHTAGRGFDWTVNANHEVYILRQCVWDRTDLPGWGGVLCVGCLEKRIGRRLKPKDFLHHPLNWLPGTRRLLERQGRASEYSPAKTVTLHMDADLVEGALNERAWRALGRENQSEPMTVIDAGAVL
jgi:hypothetical protein